MNESRMRLAMLTKVFGDSKLESVAEAAAGLGLRGIDLLVRDGYAVVPGRPAGIVEAVRIFAGAGLAVEMVTTDLIEGGERAARLLAACAEAGIRLARLGFYRYDPVLGYRRREEGAHHQLAELEEISHQTGVRLALQLHHATIHSSGALATTLLKDRDPQAIGIYVDPGNQVKEGGEDWRLTLELAGEHLCCVGVKNAGWYATESRDGPRWEARWVGLDEGMVPWADIIAHLNHAGYGGLFSFHAFYHGLSFPATMQQARRDLEFLQAPGAPEGLPVS